MLEVLTTAAPRVVGFQATLPFTKCHLKPRDGCWDPAEMEELQSAGGAVAQTVREEAAETGKRQSLSARCAVPGDGGLHGTRPT